MYAAASWRLEDTSLRTFHSLVIKNNLLGIRPVDDMRFFGDLIIATHRLGKQVSSALTPSLPPHRNEISRSPIVTRASRVIVLPCDPLSRTGAMGTVATCSSSLSFGWRVGNLGLAGSAFSQFMRYTY